VNPNPSHAIKCDVLALALGARLDDFWIAFFCHTVSLSCPIRAKASTESSLAFLRSKKSKLAFVQEIIDFMAHA
jgi:hypothetical protein